MADGIETPSEALHDAGQMFGCPPGIRIDQYAQHVRKVVARYNALNRVALAAQDYFAEHQEDGEGVPQPQLAEMLAALDWLDAVDASHDQQNNKRH